MSKHQSKGCNTCNEEIKNIRLLGEDNGWSEYLTFLEKMYCPNHSPISDADNYKSIVKDLLSLKTKLLEYKESRNISKKEEAETIYKKLLTQNWISTEAPKEQFLNGIIVVSNSLEDIVDSHLPINTTQKRQFFEDYGISVKSIHSKEESGLLLAHSDKYISIMKKRSEQKDSFDEETPLNNKILSAAINGTNTALAAIKGLDEADIVLAITGTPGHHAAYDKNHGGLCYFNNAAIVATTLANKGIKTTVLDIDTHFGNGTANIANKIKKWEHLDIHEQMWASPFSEGDSNGDNNTKYSKNYSLPIAANDHIYQQQFMKVMNRIYATNPEVLVVSLGVDAHVNDPFGLLAINKLTYRFIGSQIGEYLRQTNSKAVFITEGGYSDTSPSIIADTLSEVNRKVYKK
jgi:acetoin utilization deacetylase AcuC-like enzyme